MTSTNLARLKKVLWPPDAVRPVSLYGVLDGARNPKVHDSLARSYRAKSCLFAGTLAPELERAAPHLLELSERDSVTDYILQTGWLDAWGIMLESEAPMHRVRRHLRTLLRVGMTVAGSCSSGFTIRVLSVYLPTCTASRTPFDFWVVHHPFHHRLGRRRDLPGLQPALRQTAHGTGRAEPDRITRLSGGIDVYASSKFRPAHSRKVNFRAIWKSLLACHR